MEPGNKVDFQCDNLLVHLDEFFEVANKWAGVQVLLDENLPPYGCRLEGYKCYMGKTAHDIIHAQCEPLKMSAN